MVVRSIDEILAELRTAYELEAYQTLIGRMGAGLAAPGKKPGPKPGRKVRAAKPATKPARKLMRTPEQIDKINADVVAFIKKNPESTLRDIRAGVGLTALEMQFPIRKLKESKALKIKGAGPATRYSLKA